MTDDFILDVHYKEQEHHFTARLLLQGYTHKFVVLVGETEVYFEQDEEGSYRAVKMPEQDEKELAKLDKQLLAAIGQKIEEILA
ncbi:MAG: hypothetical protein QM731_07815 [Chitinophagaceae bacterium]